MASSNVLRVGRKRNRPQATALDDAFSDQERNTASQKDVIMQTFVGRSNRTNNRPDENRINHNNCNNAIRSFRHLSHGTPNKSLMLETCSSSSSSSCLSSRSLPILLDQRQRGSWSAHRRQRSSWRQRMLTKHSPPPTQQEQTLEHRMKNKNNNHWRDYAQRIIPFSQLQTPHCDAVLALEREGSFVMAVSEGDESVYGGQRPQHPSAPRLSLRFHGVPSPSHLEAIVNKPRSRNEFGSIVLQTTPLITADANGSQPSSAPRNHHMPDVLVMESSSFAVAASTPLRILISADGRMGAVFLRQPITSSSESSQHHSLVGSCLGDDCLGTLTLFSLPRMNLGATGSLRTFQCANVRIGAWNAFTMRNLLWPVPVIPTTSTATTNKIVEVREIPGYLLFNDEDDGFRLTWIADSDWRRTPTLSVPELGESTLSVKPSRSDIVAVPERCAWEACHADQHQAKVMLQDERIKVDGGISVVSEAFLSVEALLSDVFQRRKHLLPTRQSTDARPIFPDFSYSLIATSACGRMVDLIITFESKKNTAVGVFLRVDLFTQAYEELDWIRNTANNNNRTNASSLRKWSNLLALQRRAREMRIGPYSVRPDHDYYGHWGPLRGEIFYEHPTASIDADDDPMHNQKHWQDYLDGVKWNAAPDVATLMSPTRISYKLLYPDCEVITNAAVTKGTPVFRMTCQDSPIQIVYE